MKKKKNQEPVLDCWVFVLRRSGYYSSDFRASFFSHYVAEIDPEAEIWNTQGFWDYAVRTAGQSKDLKWRSDRFASHESMIHSVPMPIADTHIRRDKNPTAILLLESLCFAVDSAWQELQDLEVVNRADVLLSHHDFCVQLDSTFTLRQDIERGRQVESISRCIPLFVF